MLETLALFDMGLVVLAEGGETVENHFRRLIADGAVRRVEDDLRGAVDGGERLRRGAAMEHVIQQIRDLL